MVALAIPATTLGCAPSQLSPSPAASNLGETVTIFAAASLTDVLAEMVTVLERRDPTARFEVVTGGSGALARQLVDGAPADLLATADEESMAIAVAGGAVLEPVRFARNSLEIIVPSGNPAAISALEDLARGDLVIALCAEEVPCGRQSAALLASAGVDVIADTREQDVRAVLTRVALGEADAGLVYRTDARSRADIERVPVDGAERFASTYSIAVAVRASESALARAVVDMVLSEVGQRILSEAGFHAL